MWCCSVGATLPVASADSRELGGRGVATLERMREEAEETEKVAGRGG
jgi:hypothetical protein